jgi:hypothetical protein
MSDKNTGVLPIFERLKSSMQLRSDAELAASLGLSKTAFNNRKLRNSLPKTEIDSLMIRKGLNPDFIYDGVGSVFEEDQNGHTWEQGFQSRIASVLSAYAVDLLKREGYKARELKAVINDNERRPLPLLRDLRRNLNVDLNWLISGEIIETPSIVEEALLKLYRQASAEVQQDVLSRLVVANSASKNTTTS